jgi:hypothetical protein
MGIVDDENIKNVRLSVIHMRGTEEMSTKDVFKYFQDYAPQSIEWINDISCKCQIYFTKYNVQYTYTMYYLYEI